MRRNGRSRDGASAKRRRARIARRIAVAVKWAPLRREYAAQRVIRDVDVGTRMAYAYALRRRRGAVRIWDVVPVGIRVSILQDRNLMVDGGYPETVVLTTSEWRRALADGVR